MVKRRLSRKPSGEGVPEFGLFTKARESKGMSIEGAAALLDLSPRGYASLRALASLHGIR